MPPQRSFIVSRNQASSPGHIASAWRNDDRRSSCVRRLMTRYSPSESCQATSSLLFFQSRHGCGVSSLKASHGFGRSQQLYPCHSMLLLSHLVVLMKRRRLQALHRRRPRALACLRGERRRSSRTAPGPEPARTLRGSYHGALPKIFNWTWQDYWPRLFNRGSQSSTFTKTRSPTRQSSPARSGASRIVRRAASLNAIFK